MYFQKCFLQFGYIAKEDYIAIEFIFSVYNAKPSCSVWQIYVYMLEKSRK